MTVLSVGLLFALTGCENSVSDGWSYTPFKGPGFDKDGSLLLQPAEGEEFVLATTYLPVGSGDTRSTPSCWGSAPMVYSWPVDAASLPPDWREVEERLEAEGREAAY